MNVDVELKYLRQDWPRHRFRAGADGRSIVVTHPDGHETVARSGLEADVQAGWESRS